LTDDALARSLADAGRLLILETYDTSVVASRILSALRTALDVPPSLPAKRAE
jgi:hypothetical protein